MFVITRKKKSNNNFHNSRINLDLAKIAKQFSAISRQLSDIVCET